MTRLTVTLLAMTFLTTLSTAINAEDRPDHYKGLPAGTLEQAVQNFSEYNRKLEALLDKEKLSASEMATIHQLTYTLEMALNKINTELATLSETLEVVHKASESVDADTTLSAGREYLSVSRQLIK
ncbi:MAG: DUF6746 family protein [Arenicellales bacterium]